MKTKWSTAAHGKLSERERGIPGHGVGDRDPETHAESGSDPRYDAVRQSVYGTFPGPFPGGNRCPEPDDRPHYDPGQEPGQEPG
jgi:hypothetical protein